MALLIDVLARGLERSFLEVISCMMLALEGMSGVLQAWKGGGMLVGGSFGG